MLISKSDDTHVWSDPRSEQDYVLRGGGPAALPPHLDAHHQQREPLAARHQQLLQLHHLLLHGKQVNTTFCKL